MSRLSDDLLDSIYDAGVRPELWPEVMERLTTFVGGGSSWLAHLDLKDGNGSGLVWQIGADLQQEYFDHFRHEDPLRAPTVRAASEVNRIFTDQELLPRAELRRTAFFNDFMRRMDVESVLMMRLSVSATEMSTFNINRSRRAGGFEADELRRARHVFPHLGRSIRTARQLAAARQELEVAAAGLGGKGVLLLDQVGRIVFCNPQGGEWLRRSAPFRVQNRKLGAGEPAEEARLRAAVAAAVEHGRAGTLRLRISATEMVGVTVTPTRTRRHHSFLAEACVLLTVAAAAEPGGAGADGLRDALRVRYGLTEAEARLAMLLHGGSSLKEVAEQASLSINTVRSQLHRVFDKTDTHRQTELVRLLGVLGGGGTAR